MRLWIFTYWTLTWRGTPIANKEQSPRRASSPHGDEDQIRHVLRALSVRAASVEAYGQFGRRFAPTSGRGFIGGEGMRGAGLEPARYFYHQPLKLACLPFHHPRIGRLRVRYFFGEAGALPGGGAAWDPALVTGAAAGITEWRAGAVLKILPLMRCVEE